MTLFSKFDINTLADVAFSKHEHIKKTSIQRKQNFYSVKFEVFASRNLFAV